jgi:DNA-binding XRE family transcriptional regulator
VGCGPICLELTYVLLVLGCFVERRLPMAAANVFRVPMDVTYAIQGGEPALMAYRRWRNISRDDLAAKSGIARDAIEAIEDGKAEIEEAMLESLSTVLKVPQDQLI